MVSDRIHILLPVHNRRDITERFAHCLARQTHRDFHLLLIDDGSTDGTAEAVLGILPATTVLRGRGTWWWAGALQQGYEWVRRNARPDDVVLIINDDTSFDPGYLAKAAEVLGGQRGVLLHSYIYSEQTGEFIERGVWADWSRLQFHPVKDGSEVNCCSTRGVFLRVEEFLALGGFHPVLLPHYASDYEYTMRAPRKDLRFISDPAVRLDMNDATTGINEVEPSGAGEFLRKIFSKRTIPNPLYWSAFIMLSCPLRYQPRNLLAVWKDFLRRLAGAWRARST